jgi:cation diffusion facilitator family transporter
LRARRNVRYAAHGTDNGGLHGPPPTQPHGDHGEGHAHHHHDRVEHRGPLRFIRSLVAPHRHDPADSIDSALEDSREGIRVLRLSLVVLAATAVLQGLVVALSGSVALLSDTLHNLSDALTAIPLWLAFNLGRRPASRRFTYGYGRAEDLAGVFVVVLIALSSALSAWEAVQRLAHPRDVDHLPYVMAAAIIGIAGNEVVALHRIRVGRTIGSAALVADGLHARTDRLTSLAVLLGAVGVALGLDWADPVVGLLISVAILSVLARATLSVGERLMDAVDPGLVDTAEGVVAAVDGVVEVGELRLRWVGHRLHADVRITVDRDLGVTDAHDIAEFVQHELLHHVSQLTGVVVHTDPCGHDGSDPHVSTAHHEPAS